MEKELYGTSENFVYDLCEFTSYNEDEINMLLNTKWFDKNRNIFSGLDLLTIELEHSKINYNTIDWFLTQLDINEIIDINRSEYTYAHI